MSKRRAWPIHVASVIALAIAYVAVAHLGVALHTVDGGRLLVWAPTGVGLAAVIMFGPQIAPGVALGACASALIHGFTPPAAATIGIVDMFEAMAGGYVLRNVIDFHPGLDRVHDVLALTCVAVAITFFDAALIGAALVGFGDLPSSHFVSNTQMWWWSHVGGDLIVTPLVITFLSRGEHSRTREPTRWLEQIALATAVVLGAATVFYPGFPNLLPGTPRAYQLFPLLLWAGVRFGPRGAAATSFGVGAMAIVGTALGKNELGEVVNLHSFVSISSVTTLLLAALHAERLAATRRKAAIQDGALDAILTLDGDGRILELNPAAERMFLASAAVMVGRDVGRLIVPRERGTRVIAMSTIAGKRLRLHGLRSDGTEFPAEVSLTRVALGDRDIFTAFVRDTTIEDAAAISLRESRDRLEDKVRERTAELTRSEELLKTSQRLAHIGSFEVENGHVMCSEEILRIFGVPVTFKPTKDYFFNVVSDGDRERVREAVEHAKATGGSFDVDHRIVRPDGVTRVVHTTGAASGGRVQGCCQDITDRSLAEEIKQRLIGIIESTDDAVIGLTLDSTIMSWNAAAEKMFGYTREQILGQPVELLVTGGGATELQHRMRVLQAGRHLSHYDLEHRRADGTVFPASVTMSVIRDSDGRPIGYSKVLRNISREKAIEAARIASLREKEALLREVHHRVKNNLQVISSLLNLQVANVANDDARRALVDSQNRIRSMALVHQQLYQSHDLARIDLLAYLESLGSRVFATFAQDPERMSLAVKGTQLFVDIDRAIPSGLIVNELVTNSITHAFKDGRVGHIDIDVAHVDSTARITVSDNGTGLPDLFDIDHLKTFGLRIAETLSRQLGGTLTFDRTGGTRVTLAFPLVEHEAKAA